MGTQQILLIVLSVIIVGVAIAVGISMFNNQAYNANQQAVAGELQNYGAQCVQFWKTPQSQGGASQNIALVDVTNVARFIGFTNASTDQTTSSENGNFKVTATTDTTCTLEGIGNHMKNNKYAKIVTTVMLPSGVVQSQIDADGAASLTDW